MRGVEKERNQPAFSNDIKNTNNRFKNEIRSATAKQNSEAVLPNPFTSQHDDAISQKSARNSVNPSTTVQMRKSKLNSSVGGDLESRNDGDMGASTQDAASKV